jgi:poly-gamma-glutamate synthesis protein (capsule biosynthesis protein)
LNDYEGIAGDEGFRGDLALLYFAVIDPASAELVRLRMVPVQAQRFRLRRAVPSDVRWIHERLASISAAFGSTVVLDPDGSLSVQWNRPRASKRSEP